MYDSVHTSQHSGQHTDGKLWRQRAADMLSVTASYCIARAGLRQSQLMLLYGALPFRRPRKRWSYFKFCIRFCVNSHTVHTAYADMRVISVDFYVTHAHKYASVRLIVVTVPQTSTQKRKVLSCDFCNSRVAKYF